MSVEVEPEGTTFVLYRTYKDVDDRVLMTDVFWFLVSVVVAYLVFVLKIGPAIMKNRKPYQLKNPILLYNLFQVIFSAYISFLALRPLFAVGIFPKRSPQLDPEVREMMGLAAQAFYLGKFTELLDTIFFVFRKKYNQISFLHVYHHASVIIGTWVISKYGLSATGNWGILMNSLVHVAMYFYYFVAALGPQYQKYLTWKSYMTSFQMFQFATVFTHQCVSLLYTEGEHSFVGIAYIYWSSTVFFTLFYNFYQKNYKKTNVSVAPAAQNTSANDEVKEKAQ